MAWLLPSSAWTHGLGPIPANDPPASSAPARCRPRYACQKRQALDDLSALDRP